MLKADMHIHSTVSDGSETIPEIIRQAVKNGLDAIAVTDHDTLRHRNLLPKNGPIRVEAGIEISAIDPVKKRKAHILGYGIKDAEAVEAFTKPILLRRHENSLKQIDILRKHGYRIDTDLLNKADGTYIYKQHITEYLVNTGQAPDRFGDFYQRIFKNGGICDFDISYVTAEDAVRTITEAGGMAVLAHSGQQQNFYLIDRLVPLGLKGLELNHPANSVKDREIIRNYAEKYHLFLTGGSDFHGTNEKIPRRIGAYIAEESGSRAVFGNL